MSWLTRRRFAIATGIMGLTFGLILLLVGLFLSASSWTMIAIGVSILVFALILIGNWRAAE